MAKKPLRVAMLAPPWLNIPPDGYGGIEVVIQGLLRELPRLGVEVELFTLKGSRIKDVKKHYLYKSEQYQYIHQAYYESTPIVLAHLMFSLNKIAEDGKFDIIHDHNEYLGP